MQCVDLGGRRIIKKLVAWSWRLFFFGVCSGWASKLGSPMAKLNIYCEPVTHPRRDLACAGALGLNLHDHAEDSTHSLESQAVKPLLCVQYC